jgi:peptidoglycan lytic transglycosylase D
MALIVRLRDGRTIRFTTSFFLGREQGCDVELADAQVSRRHAEVSLVDGEWIIRDLQSSNGLFVDGRRVERAPIDEGVTVTLGADGPALRIEPEDLAHPAPSVPQAGEDLDAYASRYFGSKEDEDVGERTLMIRKAFQKVQQQQKGRQRWVLGAAALIALGAGGYALYAHRVISQQAQQAEEIFYDMKAQEVFITDLQQKLAQTGSAPNREQIAKYLEDRRRMQSNYEGYVASLYDRKLNEKEKLILRVTRLFGECDIAAPSDYVGEVTRYIGKWQSTGRFTSALKRAQQAGYPPRIVQALVAQGLPPQYFYLAMQESDFNPYNIGPPTRWGIAKGMWQFIPDTAERYGLKSGPLLRQPVVDLADDRLNWEKATPAAAKYIKDIYTTDAQASGLLVMASYNWGERRVIDRLRQMPANPRDRNFWKLLAQYREDVPLQTYDYVFSIVSAAVIGENPRLFGFPFDNPLASLATQ